MKKRINELIRLLSETFEGEPWYGQSVMRKLENVPYKIGYKTCVPDSHSVAEILGHLITWKKYAIRLLKKEKTFHVDTDSEWDWPSIEVKTRDEWEHLKRDLVAAQSEIYAILEKIDHDDFLNEQVHGKDYTYEHLIKGLVHHDIYHLGQIGLIESQLKRKEQDSGVFKA
ncbi:DinB family protein [Gramella sp. BOM4]|nr:DinB family protein [Christiangramia bathymodioli]